MLLPLILITASQIAIATTPDVIYGEDNRLDTVESKSALHQKLAASTAAHILKTDIQVRNGKASFENTTLNDFINLKYRADLCDGERFKEQQAASNCSGFLVAPDIVVSAGHCFQGNECETYDFVFNYKIEKAGDLKVTVDESNVYSCKKIIAVSGMVGDFAVIRLDRPVKGIAPLKVMKQSPAVGTPLVLIGHPSGLPQKIADGATVKRIIPTGFRANVDAFGGNSGSAVFNESTGEVAGILVNGADDYTLDSGSGCMRVAKLSQEKGEEGVSGVEQFLPYLK